MLYDIRNPTKAPRVIYDGPEQREIRILAGAIKEDVALHEKTVERLSGLKSDLVVSPSPFRKPRLSTIVIDGMWGIGDCLHQRALVRELMKTREVWLSTCNWHLHQDLVDEGLHLIFKETRLRGQALSIKRERGLFAGQPPAPANAHRIKVWYHKHEIDIYGSILETMFGSTKTPKPERMDFSLPIRPEWAAAADELIAKWNPEGKPLLIYRPIVFRKEWNSPNRNPDPGAYNELYEIARREYLVVSIAYLHPVDEVIVGKEAEVDVKVHDGSIPVEIMAAVVARAQLVFCNAGFMPVMAQAVGTACITVYGGRESFRTTQRAGAHLAPTLGVDVDKPCDCHTERHACDKTLTVSRWAERVRDFADEHRTRVKGDSLQLEAETIAVKPYFDPVFIDLAKRDVPDEMVTVRPMRPPSLIFATVYVDSPERQILTRQWLELTSTLNPEADILLVDSASPINPLSGKWEDRFKANGSWFRLFDFGDNIGHLSRRGRDGWGRAFCKGLQHAIDGGYEWVAHVEGDSLLRLPVAKLIDMTKAARKSVGTTPVKGMPRDMFGWVETGLMVFDTEWLKRTDFIQKYDWPNRKASPSPEAVVAKLIAGSETMLPIKAVRSDKQQITHKNVVSLDLDWITHCHNDIWCYDRFLEAALATRRSNNVDPEPANSEGKWPKSDQKSEGDKNNNGSHPLRLNLGCGTNKLAGWENHDADVDITKRLPWSDNSADFIFIEHCVEHVSYHEAIRFFEEAFRVLKPGGVLRVTVPSIEQIATLSEVDYWKFTEKWGGEPTLKGALRAILFSHGHQQAWTASLMRQSLAYAGFVDIEPREVGQSPHAALRGLEGHGKVIGDKFNAIESMPFEGTKPGGNSDSRDIADSLDGLSTEGGIQRGSLLRASDGAGEGVEPGGGLDHAGDRASGVRAGGVDAGAALKPIAIVLGGAKCVWQDLEMAMADCGSKFQPTFFVTNDTIPEFQGECVAVTLHPNDAQKLPVWLAHRKQKGYPQPSAVWAHRKANEVTNVTDDWAGSSGLFAFKVARQMGFEKVLFCGVPMSVDQDHFKRSVRWTAAIAFQRGWTSHMKDIAPFARSYSGWTAGIIGKPDGEFLAAEENADARAA